MWDILSKDPPTFIYGKGLGASYYWDEDYYLEQAKDEVDKEDHVDEDEESGYNEESYKEELDDKAREIYQEDR